jgi:hypothetical protein
MCVTSGTHSKCFVVAKIARKIRFQPQPLAANGEAAVPLYSHDLGRLIIGFSKCPALDSLGERPDIVLCQYR